MIKKIGFIKGGQLARMMIQALPDIPGEFECAVLDENPANACADLANQVVVGESKDYDDVYNFGQSVDVVVLEFEHVNLKALQDLKAEGKMVICQPEHLAIIQNKGTQKKFLVDHDIPTAPFRNITKAEELKDLDVAFPVIQKTFTDGYDGGGVKKIKSQDGWAEAFDAPSVIEDCIAIEREFSLILGRDQAGETLRYPLVEQFFDPEFHIVEFIVSPISLPSELQTQVDAIADKFLSVFSGPGLWAVELFLDDQGQILVNEIAPRVHNSGHHTIEGNATSQFAQCLRIALGLPHGSPAAVTPVITMNLLGASGHTGAARCEGVALVEALPGAYLHLYGKKETRPQRKMGHITVTGDSIEACWEKIKTLQDTVRVVSDS